MWFGVLGPAFILDPVISHILPYLDRPPEIESVDTPLVVLLHGRAAQAETIFSVEHLLPKSFHVAAIRAPYTSPVGAYEWFTPYDYAHPLESFSEDQYLESVERATETIRSIMNEKGTKPDRLFLLGFSQGAAMCYLLGLEGKLQPRGVVPMSGFFPRPIERWETLDATAKYLVTHGTQDEVLSTAEAKYGTDFLRRHKIEAEYYEYRGRHKMTLPLMKHVSSWLTAAL